MRPALLLPFAALGVACATPASRPDPPPGEGPPPAAAHPARPAHPWDRLTPCGAAGVTVAELEATLDRALATGEARCAVQAEIRLGLATWMAGDPVTGDLQLRQASLRAEGHGADDLAALAHLGRARIRLRQGDAPAALFHLERAVDAADLFAALTGDAAADLDGLHRVRLTEALAQWERTGDRQWFEAGLATAERLAGREALRAWQAQGVGPVRLLEAAALPEAAARLTELAALTRAAAGPEGPARREAAAERAAHLERFLADAVYWTVSEPLLLDWLPGRIPAHLTTLQAALGPADRLILLVPGPRYGARITVGPEAVDAAPLPPATAPRAAACPDAAGCAELGAALLGELPPGSRVWVAAQGDLHGLPLERLLPPGVSLFRVPSALGAAGLRLRALGQGPEVHPEASGLSPGLPRAGSGPVTLAVPPPPDPAGITALRSALASGHSLVILSKRGTEGGATYGIPSAVSSSDG